MTRVSAAVQAAEREARSEMDAIRADLGSLLDRAERCAEDASRLTACKDEAKEIARCVRISKDQLAQEFPAMRLERVS